MKKSKQCYGMGGEVKVMKPTDKHTVTRTKKVRGEPKVGTGGLSKRMMSTKGMGAGNDAHGKRQLRKHGITV